MENKGRGKEGVEMEGGEGGGRGEGGGKEREYQEKTQYHVLYTWSTVSSYKMPSIAAFHYGNWRS